MDFLEAAKAAIEQAIFFQVAKRLNLGVEIVLYDLGGRQLPDDIVVDGGVRVRHAHSK